MRTVLRVALFVAATLVIGIAAYNAWWGIAVRSDVCDCGWLSKVTLDYSLAILVAFQLIAGVLAWTVGRRVLPAGGSQLNRPLD